MPSRRVWIVVCGLVIAAAACRNDIGFPSAPGPGDLVIDSWPARGVGDGGPAIAASLLQPGPMAVLGSATVFVADTGESLIRKISPDGTIVTVAGNGLETSASAPGVPATEASVGNPISLTVANGTLFWNDAQTCSIYTVGSNGGIQRVAGRGNCSGADSTAQNALQQGLALNGCSQIHADASGNLVIADPGNGRVRYWNRGVQAIAVAGVSVAPGTIATIAGGGAGPTGGTSVSLSNPCDATFRASDKNLFVANTGLSQILMVDQAGTLTIQASGLNGPSTLLINESGVDLDFFAQGDQRIYGWNRTAATLTYAGTSIAPAAIVPIAGTQNVQFGIVSASSGPALSQTFSFNNAFAPMAFLGGDLLVGDTNNGLIRRIHGADPDMDVFAGIAPGGDVSTALFEPVALALSSGGQLLVAAANARLFAVSPGRVDVVAGDGKPDVGGADDGFWATGLAAVPGAIYVADARNHRVRTIQQGVVKTIGGNGNGGSGGDGGLFTAASFSGPTAVLPYGPGLLVADNDRIRFANLDTATPFTVAGITIAAGHVDSIAGANGNGFSGDGGPARAAQLSVGGGNGRSIGMALHDGGLWFADHDNNRIRRVDLTSGIITTMLGSGSGGSHGVGHPVGLAFQDPWLYWTQLDGNLVRRFSLETGAIELLAGDGLASYYGDGGPAVDAELSTPEGLVIDADGAVYVADASHRIRRIARASALQRNR